MSFTNFTKGCRSKSRRFERVAGHSKKGFSISKCRTHCLGYVLRSLVHASVHS